MQNILKIQKVPAWKYSLNAALELCLTFKDCFPFPLYYCHFQYKALYAKTSLFQFIFSANNCSLTTINICFLSALLFKKKKKLIMGLDSIPSADIVSHLKHSGNSALAQRLRFLAYDKKSGNSRHKHAWTSSAFCFPSSVLTWIVTLLIPIELFLA